MKNIIIAFILLLSISLTYTQSIDSSGIEKNSLEKHSWSLQFAAGSNLSIQSFDGLMFSLKYHFTNKSAIRFGIGVLINSHNSVQQTPIGSVPLKNDNENISFVASYLIYPKPGKFNFYFGIGPRFGYNHNLEQGINYDDSLNNKDINETRSWSVGLQFNFGLEWFPTKYFSLFAEYIAYGTYGKTNTIYKYGDIPQDDENTSETNWYFNGTTARLGLSVYF